jgi:hypothetical protein
LQEEEDGEGSVIIEEEEVRFAFLTFR